MKRATIVILSAFLMLVLASCTMGAKDEVRFSADLSAAQEVPEPVLPPGTNPTGLVRATLEGNTLTVDGEVSGLTGNPMGAHIHEGERGELGPIVFPLTLQNFVMRGSGIAGTFTLTDEQVETLMSNGYYVNVHTAANPQGEVRGQLDRLLLDQ